MRKLIGTFLLNILFAPMLASAGAVITYHGRIVDSASHPVESANVTFRIQVLSPNPGKCLLYEEVRTISMVGSDGVFVIPIGDGAGSRTAADPGIVIEKIFANDSSITFNTTNYPKLVCNTGVSYTPDPLHQRQLFVAFDDHSGAGEQILPLMDVNFVPFAVSSFDSQNLGGTPANSVLRLSSGTATPLSPANFAELNNLVGGSSTQYVRSTDLPTCGAGQVLKASGGVLSCVNGGSTVGVATTSTTGIVQVGSGLTVNGAGLLATDNAAIKSSLSLGVSDVSGLQTALDGRVLYTQMPSCTTGEVWTFVSPAAGFTCTAISITSAKVSNFDSAVDARIGADATKLPLAGGSMTGQLNLAAGTTSIVPLRIPIGTLISSPVTGGIENDGTNIYWTNNVLARQKILTYAGAPSNGQLLIGNGTGFTMGAITQGSGVTITNSAGGITISATGSGGSVTNVTSANSDIAITNGTTTPQLTVNSGTAGGAGDANKIAKLDGTGLLAVNMIPSLDITKIATGILPIARGGTNSSTALVGNRMMASTASAIVEAPAITANKALISDANGIPTHSAVTNTELGYLTGVTSAVQTQLDGKASATGWTNFSAITSNGAGSLTAIPGSAAGSVLNWTVTGPAWTSTVFPTSTTENQLLYSSANNVVGGLATANNAILTTNGSGVPSWGALSSDVFTQYALLAGRAGGQTINGGTGASDSLTLDSTSNGTKGKIILAAGGGNVGVGTSTPGTTLDVAGTFKVGDAGTACSASIAGAIRFNSTTFVVETCNGVLWAPLISSATSIPASTVVLMNSCPSGWTDNGATSGAGPGQAYCNGSSCRMCQSPATASLLPASSIILMESCPAGWTSLGAATGSFSAGYQGIGFTACQSPATPTAMPLSARVMMGTSCPASWNDLGTGSGPLSATCGGPSCHVCEVPGAMSPSHLQGNLGASASVAAGNAAVTNGNGGSVTITAGLGNGTGTNGTISLMVGNVGVLTTAPRSALDVSVGSISGAPAGPDASGVVDFGLGNIRYTSSSCGNFSFYNLKDGSSYTFVVQGTAVATCSFTGYSDAGTTALTVHMPPDNAATTVNKHTIYSMIVAGTHVYVAWTPGY